MKDNKIKLELTQNEAEILHAALSGMTGTLCHLPGNRETFKKAQEIEKRLAYFAIYGIEENK